MLKEKKRKPTATYADYKKVKAVAEKHLPTIWIDKAAYPTTVWVYVETALGQNKYIKIEEREGLVKYGYTG